jgi:two-component system chemotaxis response regulator CheB
MLSYPSRVLIISSQKSSDVDTSIQALRLGALDFIVKPVTLKNGLNELNNEILNKIRVANAINPKGIRFNSKINTPRTSLLQKRDYHNLHFDKLVVIGSSTGGPAALEDILMRLPDDFSYPVIIAQHIPHNYTDSFVESLDKISKLKVKKVENLESFVPGFIYIAPGGFNLHLKQDENKVYAILTSVDDNYGIISPSVDCLFSSAAKINKDVIACLLTGLGNDGTEGIKEIYDKKGITIAQDQESSLVYSMPEHAISGGYIQYTMSLGRIPDFLIAKSLSTM